jgi:hypothetical protein
MPRPCDFETRLKELVKAGERRRRSMDVVSIYGKILIRAGRDIRGSGKESEWREETRCKPLKTLTVMLHASRRALVELRMAFK